jgi:large subunit ribosomal protein L25
VSETKLIAQPRTQFGKGAARRIRRAHQIPAVIYGHGSAPQHVALPGHETMLALKHANALLSIAIEGGSGDQGDILALAKDVQRDPVRQVIEHVDLVMVRRGERVHVEVPVHVTGEPAADTLVGLEHNALTLEADATQLPEMIAVSVEGLTAGTQILAGQIVLPAGTVLVTDPEALVINVTSQVSAEALDAELAQSEAEAGIEHEAPQRSTEGSVTEDAAPQE